MAEAEQDNVGPLFADGSCNQFRSNLAYFDEVYCIITSLAQSLHLGKSVTASD
jgi:hypothetical protein